MKTTIKLVPVSAAVCAALVGCEWGGVHSGESWNDAYSWANFTGTYKLVSTIDDSSGGDSGSSSSSSSSTSTTTFTTNEYAVAETFSFTEGQSTYSGLKTPILPGSVSIDFSGFDDSFSDNGDGTMTHDSGSGGSASGKVNYSAGSVTVSFSGQRDDCKMTVHYTYYTVTTKTTKNGITTTTTTGDNDISTKTETPPITWLNLRQQGNLLTFEDNTGKTYSGKITGASCPTANEEGYVQAGHIRFTFEATCTSNSRISMTGSISGNWSGSSSDKTGTIANRTIEGSYHNGKSATQFQAVSGSTTVYAKSVTPAAGVTE